jgi:hypothetical protein
MARVDIENSPPRNNPELDIAISKEQRSMVEGKITFLPKMEDS